MSGKEILINKINKSGAVFSFGETTETKSMAEFLNSVAPKNQQSDTTKEFHVSHYGVTYLVKVSDSFVSVGPVKLTGPTSLVCL